MKLVCGLATEGQGSVQAFSTKRRQDNELFMDIFLCRSFDDEIYAMIPLFS